MRTMIGWVLAGAVLVGCGSNGNGGAPVAAVPPRVEPGPTGPVFQNVERFSYLGRLHDASYGDDDAYMVYPHDGAGYTRMTVCPGVHADRSASCIASVTLDGRPADVADLRDGQIVEIHGTRIEPYGAVLPESRSASVDIDIHRTVVGPVEAIDPDRARLTVLGQQVYAYSIGPVDVSVGDLVTVYGHFNARGEILATRIDPYVGDPLHLVRGVIHVLDYFYAIGHLTVDLSAAARERIPGGVLVPGDTVVMFTERPTEDGGILIAESVRCTGECAASSWHAGWATGFLTGWRAPNDFDIDGISIRPSWCECAYGVPVGLGSFVAVTMHQGNAEVYRAWSTSSGVALAGTVQAIDQARREVVVLGFTVQISPATLISATQEPIFEYARSKELSELKVGDAIEVDGDVANRVIVAGRIAPSRDEDAAFVRTGYYTLERPAIRIAGEEVLTNDTTIIRSCDGMQYLTLDEFFATSYASIYIVVDPDSPPLVAQQISVCTLEDR